MNAKAIAPIDLVALVTVAGIWGVNNVLVKIALNAMPPLFVLSARFAMVVIILAMFLKPSPELEAKGGWRALMWVTLLTGPLHFGLQYIGVALARDLSPMVVGMQLWIPASVIFAGLLLGERIGPMRIAGIVASFAGVLAMVFDPRVFEQVGALTLVALAAFTYGAGAVMVRRGPALHPLSYQAWIALLSLPVVAPASLLFEHARWDAAFNAGWLPWAAVAFGAIGSNVVASTLMFALVQKYEVSRTTPFLFLSPVTAIVLGVIVLRDPLTAQIAVGAGLTLLGVALTAMAERRLT
ncbi:MAG: DMT family transporter [Hyphomonadaceae bacterium]|nr:DMT family transporter [Hyphomonadaceae bacterium]